MNNENILQIENLYFGYTNTPVVLNASLEVKKGDFIGILGPNGSGKSTLVKLISKVLKQDSGEIIYCNTNIKEFAGIEYAKKVAIVPQEVIPAFSFSAKEMVMFGRYPYISGFGFEAIEDIEEVKLAMEKTDTMEFAERSFNELSSGEKQRVVIAKALAQKPKLLILDEPTSFLDIKHQIEIYSILKTLNKEGITVIVVSHDINIATLNCNKIAFFKNGNFMKIGNPLDVINTENIKDTYDVNIETKEINGVPFIIPRSL